jgi:hypothetical protein
MIVVDFVQGCTHVFEEILERLCGHAQFETSVCRRGGIRSHAEGRGHALLLASSSKRSRHLARNRDGFAEVWILCTSERWALFSELLEFEKVLACLPKLEGIGHIFWRKTERTGERERQCVIE